ncbi:MAG: glycosyltransferase [Actinobacteria bacterium]|nr:glycosyltransferase [Actinomycetota bacterium]
MKLAYLCNQYPSPSQTFIRREIAAIEARGQAVERYSVRPAGEVVDPDDRAERDRTRTVLGSGAGRRLVGAVVAVALGRPGRFASALRTAWGLGRGNGRGRSIQLVYLAEACVLVSWFEAEGIDHVHSHFGTNGPMVALLVQELGGPGFSFTVHGPEEFDRPEALHLREKVASARFVVAISSFGRSQLMRWSARDDWRKVHVVRCGLDRAYVDAEPTPVPDVPRFVCIGRLGEQKGQLVLIEALARLRRDGVDVRVVLAGEGEMRDAIEAAIVRHDLGSCVEVTGWVDNARVRAELERSRAMLLPSFAEGLPIAIMEALALGRPVITTSIAGIPELVDETCGWIVPAGSVDRLAGAMRSALDATPAELQRKGEEGRRRVLAAHDVDRSAEALVALFATATT